MAELSKSSDGVCMCGGRGVTRIAVTVTVWSPPAGGRELVSWVVSTRLCDYLFINHGAIFGTMELNALSCVTVAATQRLSPDSQGTGRLPVRVNPASGSQRQPAVSATTRASY